MQGFVGRRLDLAILDDELERVRRDGAGRFVLVRGRRRLGKSWLAEEFIERTSVRHVFFTASHLPNEQELRRFAESVAASTLPAAEAAGGVRFDDWVAALTLASQGATQADPAVIVVDEYPYLSADGQPAEIEGSFQAAWDRVLSRRPVLLLLIGSDLAMMEALSSHGRPLFGRPTRELVVAPLTPREVATIAGLDAEDALDAYAVIGGYPQLARSWPGGASLRTFLKHALVDPDTPFVLGAQRILAAEFPQDLQARTVLSVVGAGERAYSSIADTAGLPKGNLQRSLRILTEAKRVVRVDEPLSARPLHAPRYSLVDPYLRFWLFFVEPSLGEIERRRGAAAADRILAAWPAFRGRAIEPIVREALEHALPDTRLPGASVVGAYWTRANVPEIDLVGADTRAAPSSVAFVGSIKWRERAPFSGTDVASLQKDATSVPGVVPGTRLVAVSRSGAAPGVRGLTAVFTAAELLVAYPPG